VSLPTDDMGWVHYLSLLHDVERPQLRLLDNEYELRSTRAYMHPEILREIGDRLAQVVIAWPMLVVDSVEERLDVEGFREPGSDTNDDDLWRVWQENDCDEGSQLAHVDALVMRRSYAAVGTNEDDPETPLITYESPLEVYADVDPRTRKVRAALRRWCDYQSSQVRSMEQYATLYRPDHTVYYDMTNGWKVLDRDDHQLGAVPLVPMVNRSRLADWTGRSDLTPILPLAQAANKLATDMMVAAEFVALPLRGLFGVGPDDLEDIEGNKLTALQAMLGRLLTLPDPEGGAKQFEFTSANLANFHDSINQLAHLVASISGLPPHYLGLATDNPPSADAIRSAEIRLIKRAERKQRAFGGAHEQVMRLVRRLQTGEWDPKLRRLETVWRDPATPTQAQKADATVKLLQAGAIDAEQAQEDLGYTDVQRGRMRRRKQQAVDQVLGGDLATLHPLPGGEPQHDPMPVPPAA
jgi:hypothetical protein